MKDKNEKFTECKELKAALDIFRETDGSSFPDLVETLSRERKKGTGLIVALTEIEVKTKEGIITINKCKPVIDDENKFYMAAFTGPDDYVEDEESFPVEWSISDLKEVILEDGYEGLILNPWGASAFIPAETIAGI